MVQLYIERRYTHSLFALTKWLFTWSPPHNYNTAMRGVKGQRLGLKHHPFPFREKDKKDREAKAEAKPTESETTEQEPEVEPKAEAVTKAKPNRKRDKVAVA